MPYTSPKNRWYDNLPAIHDSVNALLVLPDHLQTALAEELTAVAEQDFKILELIKEIKSLGAERVLALYKSKNKQRDYDSNPSLHKVMNYLQILSQEDREQIARKVDEITQCMRDYLQHCQFRHYVPPVTELKNMTSVYFAQGKERTILFVNDMKKAIDQNSQGHDTPFQRSLLEYDRSGTMIRGTLDSTNK